jgi:hypothetical protein
MWASRLIKFWWEPHQKAIADDVSPAEYALIRDSRTVVWTVRRRVAYDTSYREDCVPGSAIG